MTCLSPSLLGPPSTAAFAGTGYGPGSLSDRYWKLTGTAAWPAGTVVTGMPIGPPSQVPEPKSACTAADAPMLATRVAELASTGSRDTSACHTLSAGKIGQVPAGLAAADAGSDGAGWAAIRATAEAPVPGPVAEPLGVPAL